MTIRWRWATAPIRSVSALGTTTDSRASRAHRSLLPAPDTASAPAHRDDGYTGTNVSGSRTSFAPAAAASAATTSSLSSVAARSKMAGSTCATATRTGSRTSVHCDDFVPDRDLAVGEDVGVQSAAVEEPCDHAGLRQLPEARARFAELDPDAFDAADAEGAADQRVQVDAAREDVAARLGGGHLDAVLGCHRLECLGGDQRQRNAGLRTGLEVVAVADQSLARVGLGALDRRRRGLLRPHG